MTLQLYTFRPSTKTSCDDRHDTDEFYIQGVVESLHDEGKSKHACFLELKREQTVLLKRLGRDLIENVDGSFYRNHVLLDALKLYGLYSEEFDDVTSAFDVDVMNSTRETVTLLFDLFGHATNVVVYVSSTACGDDKIVKLLEELQDMGAVTLISTVSL
ncbi:hypothetical protein CaLGV080 [Clostera anastomosis granulovirus A]|uniref:P18 n=1 Tax=Clostera anastomosis granulovirus A TaxID=1986289 RepID=U5KBM2_9BBAC|nr:hypothetical protein CaLGV080 [Clostera anastomosis granulovirus Henan]AGQ20338.1 hypothetical protein CaLGV080 [Clostera anastomosis granulovirus Henan]